MYDSYTLTYMCFTDDLHMFSSPLPTQEGTGCSVMTTDRTMLTFDTGFYSFLQKPFGCNFFNKSPLPHFACAECVMCIEPEKLFSLEQQLASVICCCYC